MCGRFTLRTPGTVLAKQFRMLWEPTDWAVRFNIAPMQLAPALRLTERGREPSQLRWGLLPPWERDPRSAAKRINARAESLATTPSFRNAFRQRRCLVITDGFYEWQPAARTGARKIPHWITLADETPFAFAGLWESWSGEAQETIETCTIITTAANDLLRSLHERMPVILPPDDFEEWLDPRQQDTSRLAELLQAYPATAMKMEAVSPIINDVKNETDPRGLNSPDDWPQAASPSSRQRRLFE